MNGPLDSTVFAPHGTFTPVIGDNHATSSPLITDIAGCSGENLQVRSYRQSGYLNGEIISKLLVHLSMSLIIHAVLISLQWAPRTFREEELPLLRAWLHLAIPVSNEAGIGPPPRSEASQQVRGLPYSWVREDRG